MFKLADEDRRHLGLLFTPSWLSGLICVVAGLIISVGVILAFEFHSSPVEQQILIWQQNQPVPVLPAGHATVVGGRPSLYNSWPLFVVWSLTGLIVYFIAVKIVRFFTEAEELRESLDYVHAHPKELLESTAERILLRVVAVVILIIMIRVFLAQVVPYSLTAAHASATDFWSLSGGLYALLSFAMVVVSIHIQIVFLRLAMGRPRVYLSA